MYLQKIYSVFPFWGNLNRGIWPVVKMGPAVAGFLVCLRLWVIITDPLVLWGPNALTITDPSVLWGPNALTIIDPSVLWGPDAYDHYRSFGIVRLGYLDHYRSFGIVRPVCLHQLQSLDVFWSSDVALDPEPHLMRCWMWKGAIMRFENWIVASVHVSEDVSFVTRFGS